MSRIRIGNGMISGVTEMILKKLNVEDISANIANITTRLTALDATIHDMQATSVTSGSLTSTGEVSLVMFQDLSSNVLSTMTDVNNLLEKIVDLSNNSAHTELFTELSTKIDTLESAINDSSARITDISGVVDSNVQQITALTGDVATAAQQITGLSGDLATTQQQLTDLSGATTAQAQQLSTLSTASTSQAQQLSTLSTASTSQAQQLSTLSTASTSQAQQLTDLSGATTAQAQQLSTLSTASTSQALQLTDLSTASTSQAQQITNLSTASTSQAQQLTDLSGATTAQAQQISTLSTSSTSQAQQLTDLSTASTSQAQQISTLSDTTATHSQQIADLSANMVSGQATVDSAQITDLSGAIDVNRGSISDILDNVFHERDASGNFIITQNLYPKVSALKIGENGGLVANKDENNVVLGYNLGSGLPGEPKYWNSIYTKEIFMHGNTIHVQTDEGSHVNWSWDGSGNSYFTMASGDGDDGHSESETSSSQFLNVTTTHDGRIDPALLPFTGLRFRGIIAADGPDASGQVLTEREADASGGDYYVIDSGGRIEYPNWDTSVRDVSAGDIAVFTDPSNGFVKVGFTLPVGFVQTQHILRHAITGNEIAPDSITSDKIAPGTVIASDISDNSIETKHIKNAAITGEKIDSTTAIDVSAITLGGVDIFSNISGDIVALQGRATTLEADVATHTQNIATHTQQIATHTSDIATAEQDIVDLSGVVDGILSDGVNTTEFFDLSGAVTTNRVDIATTKQDIVDLSGVVAGILSDGVNTSEFFDLSGAVATNIQTIVDLSGVVAGILSDGVNTSEFFDLSGAVATNVQTIVDLSGVVAGILSDGVNTSEFFDLSGAVAVNRTDISANVQTIVDLSGVVAGILSDGVNTSEFFDLSGAVATNVQTIADLSGVVAGILSDGVNTSEFFDLSGAVTTNRVDISANVQTIVDLSGVVAGILNDGVNTSEFFDLSGAVTANTADISANTQAILDLSENGVGKSAPNPFLNAFFEAMTQQPKQFLFDASDNTTNTIDVWWAIDNSGGVLDWNLATTGASIPHIDSIVLQISDDDGDSWNNVVDTNINSSTRSYQFDLGITYGGITLASDSIIDVRLYGVNEAKAVAGGSIVDRALEIIGLTFKGAGLPNQPTATFTTPSNTNTISITVICDDVDIDDATASTLKIKAYDISYNAYKTYRDANWNETVDDLFDNSQLTKTDNSFGPYTQSQISGGRAFNLTDTIYPGTSYQFQIRIKNDSNNGWSAFSSVYTTAKTKLPSAPSNNPTTISDCFNISQGTSTFYNGNTSANVTTYYINKSTTSSILTFDKDDSTPIRFELTNTSTDPEANTKYGSKITSATENLATLTVASSSVNSGKAIGSTIYFRKNSTDGTNPNYFSNLDSVDPNTNQNSGFRRQGEFNLVNITTSYFDPDNNSHTIEYSLSGSVNTSINKTKAYTFYVDELDAPTCSFSETSAATPVTYKYNCGIQSVEDFNITTGEIAVTKINSTYKFLPTGNIITVSSTESDVSTISASTTHSSFTINSTGSYNWSTQTISSLFFKAANLSSSTISINATSVNLTPTSATDSNNVTLNMFCDYASFNKSSSRITTTKCKTFYELNDPDHLDNLSSLTFSLYGASHQTVIEQWTPLFCEDRFRTSTNGSSHYINYSSFDGLSGPDYSNLNSYSKTGSVDNTSGYKWIVFKATGPTEANAKSLYDSISINSDGTRMRSEDNVEVYINKDGKWGNLTKGVEFDSTDVWWGNSPVNLSETKGVWDEGYTTNKIRFASNTGGDVYFLIGLKNSVSLSLIKT